MKRKMKYNNYGIYYQRLLPTHYPADRNKSLNYNAESTTNTDEESKKIKQFVAFNE